MTIDTPSEMFLMDDEELISESFTDMEEIYHSENSILLKARRQGQWFILKALSKEKRCIQLYQEYQQKEYDIQSKLASPYVPQVYGLEEVEGYGRCLVMEWIDGMDLSEWLESQPEKSSRRAVLSGLLDALEFLHGKQIVHRDLKPGNILVTRNGCNVKIIAFGLADADYYSCLKLPSGTVGYVSPEQQTERETDCRNDIYSLGCIIGKMNLGRCYMRVAQKCKRPISRRYADINAVRKGIRRSRSFRWRMTALFAFLFVLAGAAYAFWSRPELKQNFQEVAKFRVANMEYTSWGGLAASAAVFNKEEYQVVVPGTVMNDGLTYTVSELGFDSFKDDKRLEELVLMPKNLHILKGGFKGCPNLKKLVLCSEEIVGIGSDRWQTDLDEIFDEKHFSNVTIYVPKPLLQAYRKSPWKRFKHIVAK